MDKHTKDAEHQNKDGKSGGEYRDSLGQPNPAIDLEKKNIAEATETPGGEGQGSQERRLRPSPGNRRRYGHVGGNLFGH